MSDTGQEVSIESKIEGEAITFLFSNLPGIVVNLLPMPTIILVVFWQSVSHSILIPWYILSLLVIVFRYVLARKYQKIKPAGNQARKWAGWFTWSSVSSGCLWGFAAYYFYAPDPATQVLLYTLIVGTSAGSLIVKSYWLPSFYAYSVPALMAVVIKLLLEPDPASNGLALLVFMFLLIIIKVARNANRNVLDAIKLKFENVELINKLQYEVGRAEEASRAKTQFLASASHDLRQPVHAMALFAHNMQQEVTTSRGKDILNNINTSINSINQLLNSLLDISRLDAGVVVPEIRNIQLSFMVAAMQHEFREMAHDKGLQLDIRHCNRTVMTDFVLFGTILRNLISNAIKYTEQGRILVSCRRRKDEIWVEVRDTGIGIKDSDLKHIFREFHQVHNPERDRSKGIGLGLSICERVCGILGHKIEVKSKFGHGTMFRVILPISEIEPLTVSQSENEESLQKHTSLAEAVSVVVIDDDQLILEGMSQLITDWGFNVITGLDADSALHEIRKGNMQPDIIIADYRLKDNKTGVEAIQLLTQSLQADIPGIIITGDTEAEKIQKLSSYRYNVMHKPVKPMQLRAAINRELSNCRKQLVNV